MCANFFRKFRSWSSLCVFCYRQPTNWIRRLRYGGWMLSMELLDLFWKIFTRCIFALSSSETQDSRDAFPAKDLYELTADCDGCCCCFWWSSRRELRAQHTLSEGVDLVQLPLRLVYVCLFVMGTNAPADRLATYHRKSISFHSSIPQFASQLSGSDLY